MRHFLKASLCLVTLAGLAACETTTVGQGNLGGRNVAFHVTEGALSNDAAVTATMPNGTVYTGKLVTAEVVTTTVGTNYMFDDGFDDFDDFDDGFDDGFGGFGGFGDFGGGPLLVSTDITTYSPYARGVLTSGNRSMRCKITLSNPAEGFSGGGNGHCRLSSGRVFPVTF
ncbi:hypothetical protein PsAD2_02045 [Pseudovibrio axinellae]|uniref:Lipoprotein n=1 Tax=Pseudovibrio axinellae TaxID=989403 RepID=A0A165YWD9_9HYPH|nr:hypothetical protein [Pseudovibrio axinellae]KZL19294.1 hypothetical protein PsAD2_02045 [Pseudovibrio axinellae]SEQ42515.1 hypothetical protein SAMN05421798_102662 [Pseudovibrio axinellae]